MTRCRALRRQVGPTQSEDHVPEVAKHLPLLGVVREAVDRRGWRERPTRRRRWRPGAPAGRSAARSRASPGPTFCCGSSRQVRPTAGTDDHPVAVRPRLLGDRGPDRLEPLRQNHPELLLDLRLGVEDVDGLVDRLPRHRSSPTSDSSVARRAGCRARCRSAACRDTSVTPPRPANGSRHRWQDSRLSSWHGQSRTTSPGAVQDRPEVSRGRRGRPGSRCRRGRRRAAAARRGCRCRR